MPFHSALTPRRPHGRLRTGFATGQTLEALEPRRLLSSAPVADAGGSYQILEGQEITFDASGSSDAENNIVSYTWTVAGQVQTPSASPTLLLTWGQLELMGLGDGTAVHDVSVTVRDATDLESTATTTFTVENAPPVGRFDVEAVTTFTEGLNVVISSFVLSDFNATASSLFDYHTEVRLNGNIVFTNDVTANSDGVALNYQLPNPGSLEVRVTITDHEEATAPATLNSLGEEVFSVSVADVPITIHSFSAAPTGAAEGQPFTATVVASAASNDVLTYEWILAQHNPAGGFFLPEAQFFGPSSVQLTPRNDGLYVWQVRVRDGDSATPVVRNRQNIPVANLAPNPTISGVPAAPVHAGQTVALEASANDPGIVDTHNYYWTVNGDALPASSSPLLDIEATSVGTYTFSLVVVDNSGAASAPVGGSFDVIAALEANLAYTGQLHFTTSSSTDTTADITLRASVVDPNGGDISRATVTFFNTQTLEVYASGVPVVSDASGAGFAATGFIHTLTASSEFLHVGVEIDAGGPYATAQAQAIVSVATPGDGKVIAGGSITSSSSAGFMAAAPGTSMLFNVNTKAAGPDIKGGLEITFSSYRLPDGTVGTDLRTYLISSTGVTSLATWTDSGAAHAALIATVDVFDITNRKKKDYVLVQSGLSLEMALTDAGKKGAGDRIAFSMWSGSGALAFSSSWDGARATDELLDSGDIKIQNL